MKKRLTLLLAALAVSLVSLAVFAACRPAQRPEGEYTLTAADVTGGEIVIYVNGEEGTSAREGDGIRAALKAEEGYRYVENSFTVNGSASAFQFTMPGEDVTLSAQFEKHVYSVTGAQYEFGTVTPSVTQAACGETFTVTVTPKNRACALRRRTLCMNDTILERSARYEETVYTVTMPACDVVFRAEFESFINFAGNGTQDDPWLVASEADFLELAGAVSQYPDAIRGASFLLTEDVTVSDETFTGIGSASGDEKAPESMSITPFSGIFDGGGHTVTVALSGTAYVGLFRANTGTVKNLTVAGTLSGGSKNVGGVVSYNYGGTVESCVNRAVLSTASTTAYHYGGVVGYSYGGTIKNCTNLAPLSFTNVHTVGGIVGYLRCAATVEGCINGAEGEAQTAPVAGTYEVGGIVGYVGPALDAEGTITGTVLKNCVNYATVTGSGKRIGGVAGTVVSSNELAGCKNYGAVTSTQVSDSTGEGGVGGVAGGVYAVAVSDCHNYADVKNENSRYTGGVAGRAEESAGAVISGCTNSGTVTGKNYAGGIVGFMKANSAAKNCTNTGAVLSELSFASSGGIGGIAGGAETVTIESCKNEATVTNEGSYYTGGILGWTNSDGVKITSCTNSGAVTGKRQVGGIAGTFGEDGNRPNSVIEGCTNLGTVKGSDARIGGIAGMSFGAVVRNCTNKGDVYLNSEKVDTEKIVSAASPYTGYLVGFNTSQAKCYVEGGYWLEDKFVAESTETGGNA